MDKHKEALGGQGFVQLIDSMGSDASVVRAARVSFAGDMEVRTDSDNKKLIKYLLKNHHTSPFEHTVFTFHVKAPIFVARQWMR
jgi:thymidylate synthase (FAD)